jgi:hypothetical protein
LEDVVAGEKAEHHRHAGGRQAFDENPTEILEVLEK